MAPIAEPSYFPSLDKFAAGDLRLISWRTAYRALADEQAAIENTHLAEFFQDPDTIALLSRPLESFPTPTRDSAKRFDTLTAPINLPQSPGDDYDLDQIKADAKWLSKDVQIEESAALRMAIIEWQERPQDQLLNTARNAPNTTSRAADFTSSLLTRVTLSFSASTTGLSRLALDFTTEETRRRRLFQVFLSERNHVLRLAADLVGRTAVAKNAQVGASQEQTHSNWLDRLAGQITAILRPSTDSDSTERFCIQCIDSVKVSLKQTLDQGSWPKVCSDDPEKGQSYLNSQYLQLVNTLRLLLSTLYAVEVVPTASTVQAWFEVMHDCAFLQEDRPFFETIDTARLLVSVISVEILKLQLVVAEVMSGAGMEAPAQRGKSYIKDEAHVKVLGRVLQNAATARLFVAAPAIYAWSIIASVVKDIADVHLEMRLAQYEVKDATSRRGSTENGIRTEFETFYTNCMRIEEFETQNKTTPARFAEAAVDHLNVFAIITESANLAGEVYCSQSESATAFVCKETLLDLIRDGLPIVQYDAMVLEAVLAILTPVEDSLFSKQQASVLAGKVLHDIDQFRPAIVAQALMRYPYELLPALRLFQALASARAPHGSAGLPEAAQLLENLSSFTHIMSPYFNDYQLEDETRNTNDMILTSDVPIFEIRAGLSVASSGIRQLLGKSGVGEGKQSPLVIAAGTSGVILTENRPFVLRLDHAHSALEYLGLLLSTFAGSTQLTPSSLHAQLDRFSATEVVLLFNALLTATVHHDANPDDALFILGRLSFTLPAQSDIVSVVAEIFETELLAHLNQESQEGSVELATACAEFINILISISPERVWSILARSSLLGVTDGAISLVQVVLSETQSHRHGFLKACVRLHSLLLDDATAGIIKRKSQSARSANRFAPQQDSQDSTPERTMSEVLNAYQKILLEILREQQGWKFQSQQERSTIATGILESFSKLLKSTQGVDRSKDPSKRLTSILAPAAQSLLDHCVATSGTSVIAEVFASMLPAALPVAEDAFPMQLRGSLIGQMRSLFRFLTILSRVLSAGTATSRCTPQGNKNVPGSLDEQREITHAQARSFSLQLLQNIPILASLLASDRGFKIDLLSLLTELVQAATLGGEDPPSILAQLDEDAQKPFLAVITQLDRPLCDVEVERQVWDFLSAIMHSKQHWFGFYLLTGQLPEKGPQQGTANSLKGRPILLQALDKLSTISILEPERAIGMLQFVVAAQSSWARATEQVQDHSGFFKYTLAWVETLAIAVRDPSPAAAVIAAKECQMAAYLCEVFAVTLHAEVTAGDKSLLKSLLPKLATLRDHGARVNAYNRSLHRNLAKNFSVKFTTGDLVDFRRTAINPANYGPDYFYDTGLAANVLQHDPSWYGKARGPKQGFSDEFSRANANLSLLHAQMKLLSSWKTLATTLCECAKEEADLQLELAKIAERCLRANVSPQLEQPGVADVLNIRIQLAFVLISKLVSLKVDVSAMQDLLPAAWTLVRTSPIDYDIASAADDASYYRKLLQVLYLSIQPHIDSKRDIEPQSGHDSQLKILNPAVSSTLVDIVGKVIAPGFRALCANLHNDLELATPTDFALLTALLKAVLAVPEVTSVHTLLADIVVDSSIIRGALSLYSWSDRLAEATAQDPIYGEVAIMFLLTLSTVRSIAEQMALDGVLSQLASANLSNYFRKSGGRGPFDEPSRMFVIWTGGLLPLCLNLLDATGAPLAAEVSAFLNSFPEQLGRAQSALTNTSTNPREPKAGTVTLSLVSEAHSLTMLALILKSDIALGAAEGVNAADIPSLNYDLDGVKDRALSLVRSRRSLADRLLPTNALEERWLKTRTASDTDDFLLGRVVKELNSMLASFGDSDA
ncbi:hypothetical protein DOTSEDRAFT_67762 [Dothistroma septosporum NZE10]|uniref:Nucleoporin NUP188 n=1 Tax=Dothistroma septosporum (strain NZE10 / CBS 128990) TaxID=675120 RepID=N1Q2V3_DOTSN|nr:hypothetical protein DOTSEDRAFT_67762 [Dothistroma septosporum NZE10]